MKVKTKNLGVKVPTKELWEKVVEKAISEGCEWQAGAKQINAYYWENYRGKNVIYIKGKRLSYGNLDLTKKLHPHYAFLTAEEYLQR